MGFFGVVPLAVHSIAYSAIPVGFMGAVGLATGPTVRIGTELTRSVKRAKRIAMWCMGFAAVVGVLVSLLLYWLRVPIIRLFINDEDVLQVSRRSRCCFCSGNARPQRVYFHSLPSRACLDIWTRVCLFVFILYVFAINRAILRALGMQWRIAAVVVACQRACRNFESDRTRVDIYH